MFRINALYSAYKTVSVNYMAMFFVLLKLKFAIAYASYRVYE